MAKLTSRLTDGSNYMEWRPTQSWTFTSGSRQQQQRWLDLAGWSSHQVYYKVQSVRSHCSTDHVWIKALENKCLRRLLRISYREDETKYKVQLPHSCPENGRKRKKKKNASVTIPPCHDFQIITVEKNNFLRTHWVLLSSVVNTYWPLVCTC